MLYHTIFILLLFQLAECEFSPNVTVQSCHAHVLLVTLEHAAEGGLLFIQGRGTACSRTTSTEKITYEFDFKMCDLEYDSKFRVVVQQHAHYQTGRDKVIPVMCLVDAGDLLVTGVIYPEETIDKSLNKTIRPTVTMEILGGDNSLSLSEVTLDDQVRMSIKLDSPYLDDFDIKAKECTASLIPIVEDECSTDEELFPNFEKVTHGGIVSVFNAFQPTNLGDADDVDVFFTCNVAVCRDSCEQGVCGEIVGWGRKKRDSDDDDDIVEKVIVGTSLKVRSPHREPEAQQAEIVCGDKVVVTTVTTFGAATIVFSWLIACCLVSKLRKLGRKSDAQKKHGALRRMSERNINLARSVGRRLSSMLNLPVGYNMKGPKMMDCVPELETSPGMKRRESVTVTRVEFLDQ